MEQIEVKKAKGGKDVAEKTAKVVPPQVHMRLLIEQRDYIKRLATNRTINASGDIAELVSRGLVLFFVAAPYKEKNWNWLSPQSTYIKVDGASMPNPGWCAAHYIMVDVDERGNKFAGEKILAMVKKIGFEIGGERGQQKVLFSAIDWITTRLYPKHIYDIKHLPNRFEVDPVQLEMTAKAMAQL